MFQDEARFGRMSDPRPCWAPPGMRPMVERALVREFVYAQSLLHHALHHRLQRLRIRDNPAVPAVSP